MSIRKGIVWLVMLAMLASLIPMEALATAAGQGAEPVCFTPTGIAYPTHQWEKWKITRNATCEKAGEQERVCKRCGEKQVTTVPKTGHSFGDWTIQEEAGCLTEGILARACTQCGKKETKKSEPLGHDWGGWAIVTPASQDALGLRERVCARCGEAEQEMIAYQGEAGLKLTSGKVTRLEPGNGYSDVYAVEMTLENTGEIPLHTALDVTYGDGSGDEVITDYYIGYNPTVDNILQPGETIAFQYVACTSPLYFDGEKRIVSRLVYAGGWSEETGQRANSIAPIYIPLPAENGLLLTVDNLHRAGQGENEVLTFDLTVTNQATGWSLIAASAARDGGPLTDQEGFTGWPAEGLVLGYGQSHTFSYYFQPTANEVEMAKNGDVYSWIGRYITVQDTQGHAATVSIVAKIQAPQEAFAHLDGTMEKPEYLSLHQTADLPVSLTLKNIGDLPITDPVVKGVLTTGGGKTLRAFTLTPENGAALLQPEESASFALTAPIGAEDEMAALEDEEPLLRFIFWAEYGYEHPEMGAAQGESNIWQQSIPVWDQEYDDPKSTYILPILTGSFDDSVHHPGDKVWIDLTVENVNPTDTIQGIRFEWYRVDEKGDSSIEPVFTIDMPDITLMPGESYTLKHRFFFGVDQEEALKGVCILDFHAWCHSVLYDWNSNCDWHGLIRMEPDEEDGLSVDVTVDLGEYYVTKIETEGTWQTVEEVQGASGYYPGDVSGHSGETITYPMHPGSFSANVNVNNDSDQEIEVVVSSDHAGDLLNGKAQHQAVIPGRGSVPIDYEIVPTEEETAAGLLTRTVTATALDGILQEEDTLSFVLRDGGWKLETNWPGLTVTAGEVSQLWDDDWAKSVFIANVKVENTGDLPLSLFVESRDGSGADAWEDAFDGWGYGVDADQFQPGESFTFNYVMTESAADRMDGFLRRTLNVGGLVADSEAYVTDSVSFQFPVLRDGALQLTVDGHHRSAGPDQAITVDLTLTNTWEEPVTAVIAAQDAKGDAPAGDSLVDWPQNGSVTLAPGESRSFGYVIRPTAEEIEAGEAQRMILADGGEEPFLTCVTLAYPLVAEAGETVLVHLEGSMKSASPLALYDTFEAYLTATNLGNVSVEDVVIHGTAQSADGKCLAQLTWGASGDGSVTAPGEGLQCFPSFPVTPEMAVAALSAHGVNEFAEPGSVTFTFWAQYTRRDGGGWIMPGISNLVSFTVPIQGDTMGGIALTGLSSFNPLAQEGDPLDIHLVVENIGQEDLVGLRLDAQREGQIGFSFMQTLLDEPLDIIHPGETRPYDFHYTIAPQDADAGFVGFKFVASSESGVRPMMYVASFEYSQLLAPPETGDNGGTILIGKHQDNTPPSGQGAFRLNDAIHYDIELTNTYAFPVTNIAVYDDMAGYSSPVLIGTVDLESGETRHISFTHPVTPLDVAVQQVENTAYALVVVNDPESGETLEDFAVWSNTVLTPVEDAEEDGEGIAVTVTKTVAKASQDPKGYQEGETIQYDIVVHNGHQTDAEVNVWDHVLGDEAPELVGAVTLAPDETQGFTHTHTVSKEDVIDGSVTNEAYVGVLLYPDEEEKTTGYTAWAEPVTVPAIPSNGDVTDPPITEPPVTPPPIDPPPITEPPVTEVPPIPPETGQQPEPGHGAFCRRVLTGYSGSETQYELILCDQHQAVKAAAQALDDQAARALWADAVGAMYDALAARYPGETAALIESERELFFEQLTPYEAMLTDAFGEKASAEIILNELQNRCLDLCCALHTAPDARLDSVRRADVPALPMKDRLPDRCARETAATDAGWRVAESLCREHLFIRSALDQQLKAAETPEERAKAFGAEKRLWQTVLMERANRLYQAADPENKAAVADSLNLFFRWLSARQRVLSALYPQDEAVAMEIISFAMRGRALELEGRTK